MITTRDVEPHQIPGVVDNPHLIGFRVIDAHQGLRDRIQPGSLIGVDVQIAVLSHVMRLRGGPRERDLPVLWTERLEQPIFGAVLGHTLVIVSDAHLGVAPPRVEQALLEFLEAVPELGDCLLINGDLFDFWFSYSRVIPRRGFHVAAALARLRRQVPIVMVGGNHDRWGRNFWERDLGLSFNPHHATFRIGNRTVAAIHGDGLAEPRWQAKLIHRAIQHPATAAVYRVLHPDVGLRLVDLLSPVLGDHTIDEAKLARAAARQREWAERHLRENGGVGLLVMGHTHRAVLEEPAVGRQYLNPGAWFDGFRYAVATESGAELCIFSPRRSEQ